MLGRALARRGAHVRCCSVPGAWRRGLSADSGRDTVSERQRAAWATSPDGSGWEEAEGAEGHTRREALLRGALAHVPTHGWSSRAIAAAATEQGLSTAAVGLVARGPVELAEFFADACNSALATELAARQEKLLSVPVKERRLHF
jgi:hypothetical protein